MRKVTIHGTKYGSVTTITRLSATGTVGSRNDWTVLSNILRHRDLILANWQTADKFFLQTADGIIFNTK